MLLSMLAKIIGAHAASCDRVKLVFVRVAGHLAGKLEKLMIMLSHLGLAWSWVELSIQISPIKL